MGVVADVFAIDVKCEVREGGGAGERVGDEMKDIHRGARESHRDHAIGVSGMVCRVVPGAVLNTGDIDVSSIDIAPAAFRTLCPSIARCVTRFEPSE